jgi:hypothetical protein
MTWRLTVQIKDLITRDDSDEAASAFGNAVAERLTVSVWYDGNEELAMVVEELRASTNIEEVNNALDMMYDLADEDRVWIA